MPRLPGTVTTFIGMMAGFNLLTSAGMAANLYLVGKTLPDDAQNVSLVNTGPQHYAIRYENAEGQTCLRNNPLWDTCRLQKIFQP